MNLSGFSDRARRSYRTGVSVLLALTLAACSDVAVVGEVDNPKADLAGSDVVDSDVIDVECASPVWTKVPGGTFQMGAEDLMAYANPVHTVVVPTFEMGRTEVTVCQYAACVSAGGCTAPAPTDPMGGMCNQSGNDRPVVCVDWTQARAYCRWAGGRLCSDSEWEFSARNGAIGNLYPWGDAAPTCSSAVFTESAPGWLECVTNSPAPVCSAPSGSNSWEICDLAGNVWEDVEDDFHDSYQGAPMDGSAWVDTPRSAYRVIRGGCFSCGAAFLRSSTKSLGTPGGFGKVFGARCCRSLR